MCSRCSYRDYMKIVIFFGLCIGITVECFADNISYSNNELFDHAWEATNTPNEILHVIEEILSDAEDAPDDEPILYVYNLLLDSIVSLLQRCPQVGQNYDVLEDIVLAVEPHNHHITAQIYTIAQATVVIDGNEYILPHRTDENCYLVISVSQGALRYLTIDELHYLIARELYPFVQDSYWKKFLAPSVLATFIAASSVVWSADLQWSLCLSGITGLLSYINQKGFSDIDKDAFAVELLGNKNILRSVLNKQLCCLSDNQNYIGKKQMLQERLDVL